MNKNYKNFFLLLVFLLAGIVFGGFLGEYVGSYPMFSFLNFGNSFGLKEPLVLDLGVLFLQFAIQIKFTIAGILGMILAYYIFRRL